MPCGRLATGRQNNAFLTPLLVTRGKKYWVDPTGEDGAHQIIIGFETEEAALMCLNELRRREEGEETHDGRQGPPPLP